MTDELIQRVADAIDKAEVGYSLRLTRLLDGESTYTLTYNDGSEPIEFSDIDDGYAHIRARLHRARAEAAIEGCYQHADLPTRAEKAEREWDAALKSARFWEERYYALLDAIAAAIGSTRFMDPPDGGDVSLADQVRRMRAELEAKEARLAALEDCKARLADANPNQNPSAKGERG